MDVFLYILILTFFVLSGYILIPSLLANILNRLFKVKLKSGRYYGETYDEERLTEEMVTLAALRPFDHSSM